MRFVATKTPEQQSCLTLHRTRHLFIRQQTAVINAIRAHLAEFGIVAGRKGVEDLLHVVADPKDKLVPKIARACLAALDAQLRSLLSMFPRVLRARDLGTPLKRHIHGSTSYGVQLLEWFIIYTGAAPRRSGLVLAAYQRLCRCSSQSDAP